MIINYDFSKRLNKFEKHFGIRDFTNSQYLIIKRECKSAPLGLMAYYITNLAWIEYAVRNHIIPVIDMKNYYNAFHRDGEVGKINTWEYFFEQPALISLEEALESGKARYVWNDIPEYQPNESLDFLMNSEIVEYYREVAAKYILFKPEIQKELKAENERILDPAKNRRILGVLARGTDYVSLKPDYHPIQPSVEQMIGQIDYYRKLFECDKIYVATEDAGILETMKNIYGEDLLYSSQKRIYPSEFFLNDDPEFNQRSPFERGMEYLQSIYTLAQCNGIIAGRTSGTVGAVLMARNYEFQYIFSLGRYGVEDKILADKEKVNEEDI